jgi:hypothetical protein
MDRGHDRKTEKEKHKKLPERAEEARPDDISEIDPADFFDPEEFGYRRGGSHAPSR